MRLDEVLIELSRARYTIGLVHMGSVAVQDSPADLRTTTESIVREILERGCEIPEETRRQIRRLLRQGGYKPSGRNRPASEYLAKDLAARGAFNFINNLVDINNLLSLRHFLPMSVLDADMFRGSIHIRFGLAGERYVFNPAGQELDLRGLLMVADSLAAGSIPMGTPVKDSMAGKLTSETSSALVVVYSHPRVTTDEQMEAILQEWCDLATRYAAADRLSTRVLSRSGD